MTTQLSETIVTAADIEAAVNQARVERAAHIQAMSAALPGIMKRFFASFRVARPRKGAMA